MAAASGGTGGMIGGSRAGGRSGLPPIVVNLNSSSGELKLLRVLQTLVHLSGKDVGEEGGAVCCAVVRDTAVIVCILNGSTVDVVC